MGVSTSRLSLRDVELCEMKVKVKLRVAYRGPELETGAKSSRMVIQERSELLKEWRWKVILIKS